MTHPSHSLMGLREWHLGNCRFLSTFCSIKLLAEKMKFKTVFTIDCGTPLGVLGEAVN